ncbi:glycosyltransferase [Mycobacterium sp. 21AC1]|uniref:glycosyltransferase n=1 Tax=[Mycobacterium] appelbergii TaxID=2939269 RepID=UPI0029395163|nr:glycosyltransferase [Mycobacterium sp. 21AC1]MDV3130409.1 glycosyltransferase [Mycobacterium sp. 21AC1]
MRIAMASYGTRGDVEPSVALGCELRRRGHEVCMAVPPDLVAFAEAAGLAATPYGMHMEAQLDTYRDLWTSWTRNFWRVQDLVAMTRGALKGVVQQWADMGATVRSLADGADVLTTSVGYEQAAADVAECYDIPLIALHTFPWRPNGRLFPILPPPVTRSAMTAYDWLGWRLTKTPEDAQRRELGLPKAASPPPRRFADRGSLEIQAYDEVCFPGLATEWAKCGDRRPFVGTLTMGLTTDADEEVASWIADGTPPICFGFGSIPVESPADAVTMISTACAQLGERALICAAGTDFGDVPCGDHVKVVGAVNYAATFPACRAVVHHGGSGTTAASLRAGIPTLVLWTAGDQPLWGAQIKRLNIGASRRFSMTTCETLVADLRRILAPDYAIRAREIATRMTGPDESISSATDLVERIARG